MLQSFTALSPEKDSRRAGGELANGICSSFQGAAADAIVLFASAQHDFPALLEVLAAETGCRVIAGSSSAGEFSSASRGEGHVAALALRSDSMRFAVGMGRNLSRDPGAAAREVVAAFQGVSKTVMPYRSALVMTDALAGHTDAVVEELTLATGGNYQFAGGGAGDDGRFKQTFVFAGTEAATDAVVALEILSMQPIGIGVSHGWEPGSPGMRVTEAQRGRLISLNGAPAVEAFLEYAKATGQALDLEDPMPFFLHNILGVQSDGNYRLRVPLGVNADGSISCAADIRPGVIAHIMKTSQQSALLAAERAARAALSALSGRKPAAALVFDCIATRLRLGHAFDDELSVCANLLKPAGFVGCNTYGQIARAEGQFGGFHNCTAVVCALAE